MGGEKQKQSVTYYLNCPLAVQFCRTQSCSSIICLTVWYVKKLLKGLTPSSYLAYSTSAINDIYDTEFQVYVTILKYDAFTVFLLFTVYHSNLPIWKTVNSDEMLE